MVGYLLIKKVMCLLVLSTLILTSCGYNKSAENTPVEKQEFHMGTIITEKVYGAQAQIAADEAMKRIKQIEDLMTINVPGSEIGRLNEEAGKNEVKLSEESIYVIETSKKFAELSDGSFDVTVGPLVKTWGIFTEHPRVPSKEEIKSLLSLVGYKDLSIDSKKLTAKLARPRQIADLGGIAKGYAGDAAIEVYKDYGINSAFINLGGNVVVLGGKPDGSPWKIGVQNPRAENGKYVGILSVKDKAVVSSGDYERYFEKDGVRYHHIIDPKTGYPSNSDLIGTTIVADKSIEADALSTATFILGLDKGMKLIESLDGVDAVFISKDKKVYVTKGLKDVFAFNDESGEYQYVEKR
ncbi:MAG: FAD:protein FMN transferase [Clostridia bacterium]|nr:FAD:protein FMN transferase [Clostridia bacterium]